MQNKKTLFLIALGALAIGVVSILFSSGGFMKGAFNMPEKIPSVQKIKNIVKIPAKCGGAKILLNENKNPGQTPGIYSTRQELNDGLKKEIGEHKEKYSSECFYEFHVNFNGTSYSFQAKDKEIQTNYNNINDSIEGDIWGSISVKIPTSNINLNIAPPAGPNNFSFYSENVEISNGSGENFKISVISRYDE